MEDNDSRHAPGAPLEALRALLASSRSLRARRALLASSWPCSPGAHPIEPIEPRADLFSRRHHFVLDTPIGCLYSRAMMFHAAEEMTMKIQTVSRLYVITFRGTGTSYLITSDDAQRLLDAYPIVAATRNRVIVQGDDQRTILRPATAGGGPAFIIER